MNQLCDIQKKLEMAKSIAIFTHVNPDGDALGSSFALKAALEEAGKRATVILETSKPEKFAFLDFDYCLEGNPADFDTAIALDCGSAARLGSLAPLYDAIETRLCVDHHYADSPFGDVYYAESTSAACAELVYLLIKNMCGQLPPNTLVPLYTGISTDTGQFKFSNVTPRTHRIAAELLENGLNHRDITRRVYDTVKLAKLKFTGVLADKIQLFYDGKIAVLECFDSFLASHGLSHDEIEEIPNTVLSVEGVEVSVIIKDKDAETLKVSMRCKENIDLARLASGFGGGGHKCAAGFVSSLSTEELTEVLVAEIKRQLEAYYG